MGKTIKSVLTCDFENILHCQKKRASPLVGALAVVVILGSIYMSTGSIAAFLLGGVSVPLMVMWYVYAYSPMCVPMIPECAVQDVLYIMQWLVPLRLDWPAALQKIPGCALNETVSRQDCFIPCGGQPFRYRGWETSVAWAACDWNPTWCRESVAPWARQNNLITFWSELGSKFNVVEDVYTNVTGAEDRLQAERFCFAVTIFNIVPYLLLLLVLLYTLWALLMLPFVMLQWAADLGIQTLAYCHMMAPARGGGERGNRG